MVSPSGIEPLFPGWKPGVLTDRRRGHVTLYMTTLHSSQPMFIFKNIIYMYPYFDKNCIYYKQLIYNYSWGLNEK